MSAKAVHRARVAQFLLAEALEPGGDFCRGILAGMISKLISCDVHRIGAADPYPENYDATFAGKTIHPVTTHAMSGLGNTERDYARSCAGAVIGEGLAVKGEEVQEAGPDIESWLRRTGLLGS